MEDLAMKYTVLFLRREDDELTDLYIRDAVLWSLQTDIETYAFEEKLLDFNDDLDSDDITDIVSAYENMSEEDLQKKITIIGIPKLVNYFDECFGCPDYGDWYSVDIEIPDTI